MIGIGVVIGLLSGVLVGASSVGSGSLVTPLLLLLTPLSAGTAVGTSLALATATRLCSYLAHRRMGHVHHRLGTWLVAGAVSGSATAGLLLSGLRKTALPPVPARQLAGVLLVLLAILLFLAPRCTSLLAQQRFAARADTLADTVTRMGALLLGAAVSLVVTLTSIGSGSLLMLALLLWRPPLAVSATGREKTLSTPLCSLVGTATFCGLVATLLGTLAHLALNNVDGRLLAQLALGSVPGVLLGTRLTRRIPEHYYQAGIAGLNLLLGLRLVWAG